MGTKFFVLSLTLGKILDGNAVENLHNPLLHLPPDRMDAAGAVTVAGS
jgi:hypothetical protein